MGSWSVSILSCADEQADRWQCRASYLRKSELKLLIRASGSYERHIGRLDLSLTRIADKEEALIFELLHPPVHARERRVFQPSRLDFLPHPSTTSTTVVHCAAYTVPIKRHLRSKDFIPSYPP